MRKHNYVVGYRGDGQCVYGKKLEDDNDLIELLTLKQAIKLSKGIVTIRGNKKNKSVVYKLVEVIHAREKH